MQINTMDACTGITIDADGRSSEWIGTHTRFTDPPEPDPTLVIVSIGSSTTSAQTVLPFGVYKTADFLELLWRQTGADVDGEEAVYTARGGRKYRVRLVA